MQICMRRFPLLASAGVLALATAISPTQAERVSRLDVAAAMEGREPSPGIATMLAASSDPQLAQRAPGQPVVSVSDVYDPPARVGRVSQISGTASYHTLDMEYWEAAQVNFPVKAGDSFWTEPGARATLQLGAGVLRLDSETEIEIQQLDGWTVQIAVLRGAANFRLRWLEPDEEYQFITPSGTITLTRAGRYHIDAYDDERPVRISVLEGAAELNFDDGYRVEIRDGQSFWADRDQRRYRPAHARVSEFDHWADEQEARVRRAPSYVGRDLPGIDDLGAHGTWDRNPDYGVVWYPTVAVDWAPYRYGHWAFVAPWGWTWIDRAPWGFAPFHYGRWVRVHGRWAWLPGQVVRRPVYAPALVVFVGGSGFSFGVVSWFPLGPREVYVPPYRTSINYVRNVNITNVTNVTNITVNNITVNRNVTNFVNVAQTTVVSAATMTNSRSVESARVERTGATPRRFEEVREAPVKPTLATRGATRAVVAAVGGDLTVAPPAEIKSPGPKVRTKAPTERILRPLVPTQRGGRPDDQAPAARRGPQTEAAPAPRDRQQAATPGPGAPVEATPAERGRPNADAPVVRREQPQAAIPRPDAPDEAAPAQRGRPNADAPAAQRAPQKQAEARRPGAPVEATPAERGRPNADAPDVRREQPQTALPRPGAPDEAAPAHRGRPNADAPAAQRAPQKQAETRRPGAPVETTPAERGRPNADAPVVRREQPQAALPRPGAPDEAAPAHRGRPNADAPAAQRAPQQRAATPRPDAPVEATPAERGRPDAPVEAAPAQRGRPNAGAYAAGREQAALPRPGAPVWVTGKISTWNAKTRKVTLDNNRSCTLAGNVTAPADIAVGKRATISYLTAGDENICTAISVR